MDIGTRLHYLRTMEDLSLSQLGELADGLSKGHLSSIENGDTMPSIDTVEKLATAFRMSIAEFLGEPTPDLTPDENALLNAYRAGDLRTMMQLALERTEVKA